MPYPSAATGDLSVSVVSSLFNRVRAASMLGAQAKKEAFKRFKSVGLTDKQAQDAVDNYNFGGAALKSRFGGDRARRIRGFFGSKRPQDDITISEKERVLRGMGLFKKKRKGGSQSTDSDANSSSNGGGGGGEGSPDGGAGSSDGSSDSFSPMQGLLPPAGNNLEEALKGVGRDGEYLTKEQRIDLFKKNKVSRNIDDIFDKNKSKSSEPTATTSGAIQKASTGDLVGSAIEKLFEDKNKELIEVIKDTADKVDDHSEILEKIERNTSFIEKLFDLQKEAIDESKAAAEEAQIDKTRDTSGVAGYKKLKFGGKGGILSGIPGGGMLGNILDFGGDALDLFNGRYRRRSPFLNRQRGARRRLAKRRVGKFLGNQRSRAGKLFAGKQRTPIGTRSTGRFVNNRLYKTEVSQFAPKNKNFLQKGLQKTNIAGRKLGKKLIGKTAKKAGAKAIAKGVGKGVGKALLKKIPILGLGVGALFAAQRAMAGDFVGAGLELASGAASTVPGLGTAASVGIDAALMAKDFNDESQMMEESEFNPGGEYEYGGISEGPETAILHGKEAVIPLDTKKSDNTKTESSSSPIMKFFGNTSEFIKNISSYSTSPTTEKTNNNFSSTTENLSSNSKLENNILKNFITENSNREVNNNIAAVYGGAKAAKIRQFMKSLNDPSDPFYMAPSSGGQSVPRGRGMGDINPDAFINPFNNKVENKQNIFAKGNTTNFFDKGVQNVNIGDTVKAERGAVLDGPDTGYEVELHGTEAIIPLDNKFTRGEPTVTEGGEYEKGNITIEHDVKSAEEKIKSRNDSQEFSMLEKRKAKKDLSEAFSMGLEHYEEKTPGGFLGKLGEKIMDFLNKFGGGNDGDGNDGGGRDAPEVDMSAAELDNFTEQEVSDLGRIVSAEAGTDEKGGAHVLNAILNRHRQIKSGKASPESWGIQGKSAEEVTITDIINATNQFEPMRDGSFEKTTESQGRQALAAAIKGGGLDPREVKKKLVESGMSEEDASIVAVADSFYNPTLSSNKPFASAKSVSTDNQHAFMSSPNVGFKPEDLDKLDPVTGTAPEEITSGDTEHHPNQKIVNNYGLQVGEEREFITSRGTKVKAHKTTKGFDFYNPGINQKIDFSNGKNSWVVDDFVKTEGGLKPEMLKPETQPEPPSPERTGSATAEEVGLSSSAAREATTAKTIAMVMPQTQQRPAPQKSGPDGVSDVSPKPTDLGFDKLTYTQNLFQLNSVG